MLLSVAVWQGLYPCVCSSLRPYSGAMSVPHAFFLSARALPPQALLQRGPRMWAAVLVVLLVLGLTAAAFTVWGAVQVFRTHTQQRLVVQQNTEADVWARMLTARMEAHQRLLTAIAQGMHSSLLDKPAVLDALMQQDGSMLRLFESLHVGLPNGAVSHHSVHAAAPALTAWGTDALRRTMAEGKPSVVHMPENAEADFLRVLLTVPMRSDQGTVSAALAAVVKLPLAALLPQSASTSSAVQYMLLDSEGVVMVHSNPQWRGKHVLALWASHWQQWQSLSQPSVASADTQYWGRDLVTRVGMPLPQWQAVVIRNTVPDTALLPSVPLPWFVWGALALLGLVAVAAGALWALRMGTWRPNAATGYEDERMPTAGASAQVQAAAAQAHHESLALLALVPSVLLLERDGRVAMATPQVAVVLGYFMSEGVQLAMDTLFEKPQALMQVRQALVDFGSFEGQLQLRKKDGDAIWVDVWVGVPMDVPDSTVWRLRLPWRQRSAPMPGDAEHGRDSLTGLPSRDALIWSLQSWMAQSLAPQGGAAALPAGYLPSQGCMLFADIDHLGLMNEVTSRDMGNKVLRYVGHWMASHLRPLGDVCRLGGDEFAVPLPGVSLAHAQGIAQALCDTVARWQPSWGGERHWVSISIGIVAVDAQRHTPEQALHAADMACYEAKRRGRGQVAVGQISAHTSPQASTHT